MKILFTARNKDKASTEYISLEQEGLQAEIVEIEGDGSLNSPSRCRITIANTKQSDWEGIIHITYQFPNTNPRFYLPGFMYGRNRGEAPLNVDNEFPRLRTGEKNRPAAPWWMVRSDRLSHPMAFVFDEGRIYGLSASPYYIEHDTQKEAWYPGKEGSFYQYAGYSCSLENGSIGYTLGYENAPWQFIETHDVREHAPLDKNCFQLRSGEEVTFEMQLYNYEAKEERCIFNAVQKIYEQYHEKPRIASDIPTAVADITHAVSEDAWMEEGKNYSLFVYDKPEGFDYTTLFSISWTNGLTVAVPILMSAIRLNEEKPRLQALECIQNIVLHSINPSSGLPYEAFNDGQWSNHGWWFDRMRTPGHSSYLIGQALYYLLKAYDYEKQYRHSEHCDWLEFVWKVLTKIEKTKNTDYEYPYILSERTGAGLEYDSMAGAWCMASMAYYSWLVKDYSYMEGLKSSEKHYYETFVKKAECYGGPLDTDKAVDSEGILAYIRAVRWLHSVTKEDLYLEHLRDALCYEFTFKFCYNSPIKTPPLSKVGWSSCGGSITSVANPHIHPMSSTVTDEMLYYINHKKDAYIESRLKDTITWSCQTYNRYDREYDYGRKGWMSERFCHSEGLLKEKYPDGSVASTWFALMPWACGGILEGLSGECWSQGFELSDDRYSD